MRKRLRRKRIAGANSTHLLYSQMVFNAESTSDSCFRSRIGKWFLHKSGGGFLGHEVNGCSGVLCCVSEVGYGGLLGKHLIFLKVLA